MGLWLLSITLLFLYYLAFDDGDVEDAAVKRHCQGVPFGKMPISGVGHFHVLGFAVAES